MSDKNNEVANAAENEDEGFVDSMAEFGSDVASSADGLPAPIKKGLLKTAQKLGTAVLDLGVAKVEGKTAEIRAVTEARAIVTKATADEIAQKVQVPTQFVNAAVAQHYEKIVGRKIVMNEIVNRAAEITAAKNEDLQLEKEQINKRDAVIDDEILNEFERQAETKTTEEMKRLFSALLAKEIIYPGAISVKTVKAAGDLTPKIAKKFQELCSMCVYQAVPGQSVQLRIFLPSTGKGIGQNGLEEFGFSYGQICELQDYGLLSKEVNTSMDYSDSLVKDRSINLAFAFDGGLWGFAAEDKGKPLESVLLSGMGLSTVGKELFQVVDRQQDRTYNAALMNFLKTKNIKLVPCR